jgi:hypothetical protein
VPGRRAGVRQRLNDNPMFALAFVGVLGIAIAFLFMTRMSGSSSESTAAPTATATTAATTAATTPPASTTGATPAPTNSTTPTPAGADGFVAGPGLPKPVVTAYKHGDIVVLLVFKRNGIDDQEVRRYVSQLSHEQDTKIFQTSAKNITDYSRIAVGVDLNRVPAIVVVEPSKKSKNGASPQATVSYGFHGVGSIEQAIRDAKYNGPEDLPTYPR